MSASRQQQLQSCVSVYTGRAQIQCCCWNPTHNQWSYAQDRWSCDSQLLSIDKINLLWSVTDDWKTWLKHALCRQPVSLEKKRPRSIKLVTNLGVLVSGFHRVLVSVVCFGQQSPKTHYQQWIELILNWFDQSLSYINQTLYSKVIFDF